MKEAIVARGRAGYPLLYCPSDQEVALAKEVKEASREMKRDWYGWTCTNGLFDADDAGIDPVKTAHPVVALQRVKEMVTPPGSAPSVFTFFDFRPHIANNTVNRHIRDLVPFLKLRKSTLVLAGPDLVLPPELRREAVTVELEMPTPDTLTQVLSGLRSKQVSALDDGQRLKIVRAARGLTASEAENAFALAASQRDLTPRNIWVNKAKVISREEMQFIGRTTKLSDVGGLDLLKEWLMDRRKAFSSSASDYGLEFPRGIVLVGPPGTAKSMLAKAIGDIYDCPTMRLSIGACMHELIGRSERILREAIFRAEAIAPVVLWLDEIEKMFAGAQSSGQSDSGLFRRMFAEFLTWLSDRTSQVFVVATANAVYDLPPELTRCGRFDQIFWIDLPNYNERCVIAAIHTAKRAMVEVSDDDILEIAAKAKGYSGAEIEQSVKEGMFAGFNDGERKTNAGDIIDALKRQHPTSEVYREEITRMRRWATSRCRPASSLEKANAGRMIDEAPLTAREALN